MLTGWGHNSMAYSGINFVLDLEACLYFSEAGGNLKAALFQRAKVERIAVPKEVFDQVRIFDKSLADEISESDIEIVELDSDVYVAACALNEIFMTSGHRLNAAANEKVPVIALVHCAQNGAKPPCHLVSGDNGLHSSSMRSLCAALKVPFTEVTSF